MGNLTCRLDVHNQIAGGHSPEHANIHSEGLAQFGHVVLEFLNVLLELVLLLFRELLCFLSRAIDPFPIDIPFVLHQGCDQLGNVLSERWGEEDQLARPIYIVIRRRGGLGFALVFATLFGVLWFGAVVSFEFFREGSLDLVQVVFGHVRLYLPQFVGDHSGQVRCSDGDSVAEHVLEVPSDIPLEALTADAGAGYPAEDAFLGLPALVPVKVSRGHALEHMKFV